MGLFVGELGAGVDDGVDKFGVEDVAGAADLDDGAFGEAIDVGLE